MRLCFWDILALMAAYFFFIASLLSFAEISTLTSCGFSSAFYPPWINSLRYSPICASFLSLLHADFSKDLGNLYFSSSVTGALAKSLFA
jgi:hypothetical protein